MTLGDDPEYFDKTLTESSTRNNQAMAAGAKPMPTSPAATRR